MLVGASKTTMTQAVARYEAVPREGSLLTAVGRSAICRLIALCLLKPRYCDDALEGARHDYA
jgi:hypothetical protein